jgi:hypothetical protein
MTRFSIALPVFTAALMAGGADAQYTKKFFEDDPLWRMPRPAPATAVVPRSVNDYYDFFENTLFKTGERAKRPGEYLPSEAINTVDEVPDSAWYTNRHATARMTEQQLQAGPGNTQAPAEGPWTVVAAKNEGVTPGFRIRDSKGRVYLLKFDPLTNPEMASAADVITSKFFYALGYNVPENYIVRFAPERIEIGRDASFKDAEGHTRNLRREDVAEMLEKAPRSSDGTYRALASLLIAGKAAGPFRYRGTRPDDPNDLVLHENRRDLRGLRTLCAWLGHDDSKSLNSLDVLAQEDGIPYVKHHLIDFGASLGSASFMANSPRDGNVYLFSWRDSAAQLFSLGFYAPKWQRTEYPKIPAVGRFEYANFDPDRWVPDYPNPAFANENPGDRLWAARKIAAFTDQDIRAIVATGEYSDPEARAWVERCLIERRNKILKAYLHGTAALDHFAVKNGRLEYRGGDTAQAPGVEWSTFDNQTGTHSAIEGARDWRLPESTAAYLRARVTDGEGPTVSVYVSRRGEQPRVVGIERHFHEKKN